jgi:hypothetical protein
MKKQISKNKDKIEMNEDFFSLYLTYTEETECPTFFHRWCAVTSLAAYLGRSIYFTHGHFILYPNLYCMLVGSPGTKKSSAIKIGTKLLKLAGYNTFAAKKTRQEKFLMDLAEQAENGEETNYDDILNMNLFGPEDLSLLPPAECFVAADEFNNFIGVGNLEFMSLLGELWDYEGIYDYKLKNSKSVKINNPTINILGGNTLTGFSQAFPTEAIGQGFFSRLILVYGEPSGIKYTFPPSPDEELQFKLIQFFHKVKERMNGEVKISQDAIKLFDKIYKSWEGIDDVRFEHYTNRRLTHLIKLCLIFVASRLSMEIEKEDVIYANTLLTFTEHFMPKALGEFGKARNSDVSNKIMQMLDSTLEPLSIQTLWKGVHQDLERREQLAEILGNLMIAEKIQTVKGGYLPIRKVRNKEVNGTIDWNLLTQAEIDLL